MEGHGDGGVYFSDTFGPDDTINDQAETRQQIKRKLKNFFKEFYEDNVYVYRDQIKRHYNLGQYWVEVSLSDLDGFDGDLAELMKKSPADFLPTFENAAKEVAIEILQGTTEVDELAKDFQVILKSPADPCSVRDLKSDTMANLVKISGIVISVSSIKSKATRIALQCRGCRNTINDIHVKPGLEGYSLPRKCTTDQAGGAAGCPLDPYYIIPEKCQCVDYQVLKLQELPESVPSGEVARHMTLYCDRYLCEKAVPGNRVTVTGIYSIKKMGKPSKQSMGNKISVGIRPPYLRVVGIDVNTEGSGRSATIAFTPEEEDEFKRIASNPNVYDMLADSIAPSIAGRQDIKKAIVALLFGGSRKRLPDGLNRRGDINLLLLGDPGTAKSQLLKFVEQCSPVCVYTSGKGSSAAGLTASVLQDPGSRSFVVEGGAMVLADGGVVCIDEFDKMRQDDRVAIHEAMEQQTISIAKAGITTTLNSRCSVLAAANSVFGRWDDTKGQENIEFMPTILSRFDMIFIIKDVHDREQDMALARHVMNVHTNRLTTNQATDRIFSRETLKKFIAYCRSRCGPRLSVEAAEKLKNQYVIMRSDTGHAEREAKKRCAIPITVRQLEAVIRISESFAKMRLEPFATEADVDEALRLFRESTVKAAKDGGLAGTEGFTTEDDQEIMSRIEQQIKKRFIIGSQVSEHAIINDFSRQKYSKNAIQKVLFIMIRRGELQFRMQRKMLYRVK